MITFNLWTNSSIAYDLIMKYLTEKGRMFSRDGETFEITGSVDDYNYFNEEIKAKRLYAALQETV